MGNERDKATAMVSFLRSTFDKKKFDEDKNLLAAYYRNKGYRDFNILSDSIFYSSNDKRMNIVLSVDEGPQYSIETFHGGHDTF